MRVRAWWRGRAWKEKAYAHAHALHDFEDEVILRKLGERSMTAGELVSDNPDLFHRTRLRRALKRLDKSGVLERDRVSVFGERRYQAVSVRRKAC